MDIFTRVSPMYLDLAAHEQVWRYMPFCSSLDGRVLLWLQRILPSFGPVLKETLQSFLAKMRLRWLEIEGT